MPKGSEMWLAWNPPDEDGTYEARRRRWWWTPLRLVLTAVVAGWLLAFVGELVRGW